MAEEEKHIWQIGRLVRSKQGRDKGKYYLILSYEAANKIIWLVDGQKRGLNNPKKKNCQHVQIVHKKAEELAQRTAAGKAVSNQDIYRFLQELVGASQ